MTPKDAFRLIRLPNLLTIVLFQSLLHFGLIVPYLAEHGLPNALSTPRFLLLMAASVCLAAGGNAINDYFVTANRIDKEEELKVSLNSIIQAFKSRDKADALIADAKAKDAKRLQSIRFLRNNPRTPNLDLYLAFLADNTAPADLRTVMAEALGWFNLSWRKNDIVAECEKLLETSQPEELKEELLQTINRIRQ